MRFLLRKPVFLFVGALVLVLGPLMIWAGVASASHSWGGYHWARISNPFTLKLGDNVSSTWDGHLLTAAADWDNGAELIYTDPATGATSTYPDVLNLTIVPGTGGSNCKSSTGTVQVCNRKYGFNGWLGIAQIWIDTNSHIVKGITKMNDSYFNTSTYNKPEWRQFVMCQEIGHTFGLDHQDENFNNANLGSCMDYTSDPSTNQHPNAHDFEQLASIYGHSDSYETAIAAATGGNGRAGPSFGQDGEDWGQAVRTDGKGRPSVFVKNENGGQKITWVYWANGQ